ncbi:MAG: hypothetical protein P1V51_05050 [Deltaproteobacteria bacterium]|nr:hypothetical protein [Deltaproteobacteria bacterium]
MVATVLIDFQTAFPVGVLLVLFARRQIESEQVAGFTRYVRAGAIFGLIYGLAVGYWCFAYPDWMWGYAVDAAAWPTLWWYPGFVLALGIVGGAGSWMAQALIARGRFWWALGVGLFGAWLLISVWAMTFDEYMNLSTYADWHAIPRGPTMPTNEASDWAIGSVVVTIAMLLYAIPTMAGFFLEGRRLPRH